jgi:O-antigen ligase
MVLDELTYMSRFKGSKPVPRGASLSPSEVRVLSPLAKPPSPSATTIPALSPSDVQIPARRVRASHAVWQSGLDNPLRKLGLYLALAFIFCRFSLLGEVVETKLNFDPHLVRIIGIPTIVLAVITGGLWRVFQSRIAYAWLGLLIWMALSTPVSYWPGGSSSLVINYLKGQLPMVLIIGGLVLTWRECKLVLGSIALACAVNVLCGRFFVASADTDSRLSLELGTIGNANDLTAHLFFVLPMVIFVLLISDRGWLRKILCLVVLGFGVYFCAATGSRGGLVAFAVACIFILFRAPGQVRIGALAAAAVMLLFAVAAVSQPVLHRYATLFTNDSDDLEAVQSTAARTHLLKASIRFTMEHPVFGVGPGEFSDYEAAVAKTEGKRGTWLVTHNAYTQVSSEVGIPALLFFLAAIVMSFRTFGRVQRAARAHPQLRSMAIACFCCQLSLVGFCTAIMFLSLAYTMYLPTMGGLAMAFSRSLERELAGQS